MAFSEGQPRIYYEVRGDLRRPVLVLIRGLGRSLRHWPDQLLDALSEELSLLLLDNRGVGHSGPIHPPGGLLGAVRQPLTTSIMATDVARVMAAAGVTRAHVFGMSLGGMVAQRLAIEHPERVDRLVLGCTTCGGPQSKRAGLPVFSALVRARLRSQREAIETEAAVQLSADYRRAHPEVVDAWQALAQREPVDRRTMLAHVWAAASHRSDQELHRIRAHTLVLSSDADRLMPPDNSVQLARRIQGAELCWIEGAGHDFVTEQPRRCAQLIRRFVLDADAQPRKS